MDPGVSGGLEKWLNRATLIPIESDIQSKIYRFSISEPQDVIPYISYDFERFSLAAVESFLRSTQIPSGSLNYAGWRLLELYYSAFFSCHGLTRSQGAGVTVINSPTAKRITDIAELYGVEIEGLEKGSWFYRIVLSDDEDAFLEFRPVSTGSGIHDSFWREFCSFLHVLASGAVENRLPESAEFLVGATEISDQIRFAGDGSGSWLAKIRNDINYRHEYNTWYPEPKVRIASLAMDGVRLSPSASIRLDTSRSKDPLAAFARTCGFLTSLSYELSSYVAERSSRGGAFGQKWRRFTELTKLKMQT